MTPPDAGRRLFPILLVLIFFSLIPTLRTEVAVPPLQQVLVNNTVIAERLPPIFSPQNARGAMLDLAFRTYRPNISAYASTDIAGLTLMVDNLTYARPGLSVVVVKGSSIERLRGLGEGAMLYCDLAFFTMITDETAWRCDFDDDYCAEYELGSMTRYNLSVTFTFRNQTVSMPIGASSMVNVPNQIMEQMTDASGAETLNVTLEGRVEIIYMVDDRSYGHGDCSSNYRNITVFIPVRASKTFEVAGKNKVVFLRSPILREQWYKDAHFNLIVLSESPLFRSELFMDDNRSSNYTLRTFEVVQGQYGLLKIVTNKYNETGANWSESKNFTRPIQLEESNSSFAYIYEFNESFDPGSIPSLGTHNFSFTADDVFLAGQARYEDAVEGRMLTYNGIYAENGSEPATVPSRRSPTFGTMELIIVPLSLGVVGLILLLPLVNKWLGRN